MNTTASVFLPIILSRCSNAAGSRFGVIHFDPWWNPAAESQATDRAYRIGQDKPVFVYKLIASGTVEETILAMQEKKKDLIDGLLDDQKDALSKWGEEDLDDLFKPLEME